MDATRAHGLLFELDSRALVLGMGVLPLASVSLSLPKDQALKAGRPLLAPRRRPARRLRGGETATAKPESSGAAAQAENPLQRVQAAIGGLFVLVLGRAQTLHPATRRLIAGGISGAVSKTATAPLETLKMKLVQGGKVTALEAARQVLLTRGVGGFFAGNLIDVLRTVPSKSLELAAFDTYKKALADWGALPDSAIGAVAGGLSGITSTIAVYPLETIRTRMAVNGHGFLETVRLVATRDGFPSLYRGLDASLIGAVPYTALRLGLYDALKYSYMKTTGREHLSPQASLVFGAVAGVVSATATFPLEVARRRMMVGAAYPNTAAAIATIARTEGAGALFNGVWLALVKQAPQYAIGFMVYEQCKRALAL